MLFSKTSISIQATRSCLANRSEGRCIIKLKKCTDASILRIIYGIRLRWLRGFHVFDQLQSRVWVASIQTCTRKPHISIFIWFIVITSSYMQCDLDIKAKYQLEISKVLIICTERADSISGFNLIIPKSLIAASSGYERFHSNFDAI